jgi:hypothetical protein
MRKNIIIVGHSGIGRSLLTDNVLPDVVTQGEGIPALRDKPYEITAADDSALLAEGYFKAPPTRAERRKDKRNKK